MAHVIIDTCEKDMLCIDSCPSDAIHPLKDEGEWETASQLYINPEECMDCGACITTCPTNSIYWRKKYRQGKKNSSRRTQRITASRIYPPNSYRPAMLDRGLFCA